ncbi:MAG: cupredoxin domain-containing protein [Nitrososphaeraceae archaeon]
MKQRTGSEMILLISMATVTAMLLTLIGQQASFAQQNTTESNMTSATGPGGGLPSMSTPGEKTFYVFTAEVENVDEDKLKIAGDSFDVKTLVVNQGDKVTVKFYNVDDVQTERHSFTIGDPYKVDIDVGFGGNGNATFTADHTGVFTYYCKYHLPVMTGQLVVLP